MALTRAREAFTKVGNSTGKITRNKKTTGTVGDQMLSNWKAAGRTGSAPIGRNVYRSASAGGPNGTAGPRQTNPSRRSIMDSLLVKPSISRNRSLTRDQNAQLTRDSQIRTTRQNQEIAGKLADTEAQNKGAMDRTIFKAGADQQLAGINQSGQNQRAREAIAGSLNQENIRQTGQNQRTTAGINADLTKSSINNLADMKIASDKNATSVANTKAMTDANLAGVESREGIANNSLNQRKLEYDLDRRDAAIKSIINQADLDAPITQEQATQQFNKAEAYRTASPQEKVQMQREEIRSQAEMDMAEMTESQQLQYLTSDPVISQLYNERITELQARKNARKKNSLGNKIRSIFGGGDK